MEAEFPVQRQMQRALRESTQPGMARAPGVELRADGLDQAFADPAPLPVRIHRDRPEEPDAAPIGDEVGSDQLAVDLCATCSAPNRQ